MSKILITGGAGFIGSQLGYHLSKNNDVYLLDNMKHGHDDNLEIDGNRFGEFINADIRDEDFQNTLMEWIMLYILQDCRHCLFVNQSPCMLWMSMFQAQQMS